MDVLLIIVLGAFETLIDWFLFWIFKSKFRPVLIVNFILNFLVPVVQVLLIFYSPAAPTDKILSLANFLAAYSSSLPEYLIANIGSLLVSSIIYTVTGKRFEEPEYY